MKFNKRTLELAAKFGPDILALGLIFYPSSSKQLKELNSLEEQDIKELVEYLDNFSNATGDNYDKTLAAHEKNLIAKGIGPNPLLIHLKQTKNLNRSSSFRNRSFNEFKEEQKKTDEGVERFKKITTDLIKRAGDTNEVDIKDDDFHAMLNPAPIPAAASTPLNVTPDKPPSTSAKAAPPAAITTRSNKKEIPVSDPKGFRRVEINIPELLAKAEGRSFHKPAPTSSAPGDKVPARLFEEEEFKIAGTTTQPNSTFKHNIHITGVTEEDVSELDPEKAHDIFIQTIKNIQRLLGDSKLVMPKTYGGKDEFNSLIQSLISISMDIEGNKYGKETPIENLIKIMSLLENQISLCIPKLDNSPRAGELKKELNRINDLIKDFYTNSRKLDAPAHAYVPRL